MFDDDHLKRAEEIRRGEDARRLLEDPLLAEAFDTLEASYVDGWRLTPVMATEQRERIWQHLKALEQVRQHLLSVLETGRMARHQLDELTGQTSGKTR